jgi:hypothetical protein
MGSTAGQVEQGADEDEQDGEGGGEHGTNNGPPLCHSSRVGGRGQPKILGGLQEGNGQKGCREKKAHQTGINAPGWVK